jgi:hypothetical protein
MPADSSASVRHIPDDANENTLTTRITGGAPKFGFVLALEAAGASWPPTPTGPPKPPPNWMTGVGPFCIRGGCQRHL